ncbi:MAG: EamA family transporter [Verrucomicrobiaceae bacterium]|nr:EamA family transporter [Verrucomicrobiaceae bacterium]
MTPSQLASLPYIFMCIGFTVTGQLLMKWGMLKVGKVPSVSAEVPMFLLKALFHPGNFFSLVCAFLAVGSWMAALSRADISFAYPFMSLAIVLVLALTPTLFSENVAMKQWIGVGIVCLGLYISSRPS